MERWWVNGAACLAALLVETLRVLLIIYICMMLVMYILPCMYSRSPKPSPSFDFASPLQQRNMPCTAQHITDMYQPTHHSIYQIQNIYTNNDNNDNYIEIHILHSIHTYIYKYKATWWCLVCSHTHTHTRLTSIEMLLFCEHFLHLYIYLKLYIFSGIYTTLPWYFY